LQYENSFISDESEDEVSDEDKPVIKGTLETCKSNGNLLKVSANLIKQIERELELNRSEIKKEISRHKQSYYTVTIVLNHSHGNEILNVVPYIVI
jgi:hypothetical protein